MEEEFGAAADFGGLDGLSSRIIVLNIIEETS